MVRVACSAGPAAALPGATINSDRRPTSSAAPLRTSSGPFPAPSQVDPEIAAFAPAELLHPLPERTQQREVFGVPGAGRDEHADASNALGRLRPRARAPNRRSGHEPFDDLPPLHRAPLAPARG